MAEQLKRQYDLVVLKLSLAAPSRERSHVSVHCEIEAKVADQLTTLVQTDLAPEVFGIPKRLDAQGARYQGYDFTVPAELVHLLQNTLAEADLAGRPLWLHLVAPYGYLGLVPWERLLVPQLHIPILRLPDFIVPPPVEVETTLDVVLCCSVPSAKEPFDVVSQLSQMVDRIREAAPRQCVKVHVFADREFYSPLLSSFSNRGLLDARAVLYEPSDAYSVPEYSSRIIDPGARLVNPWLLWMRDALKGRSIDVVHFLCHGYFANDRGAIAFSQSPTLNEDSRFARFVGMGELDTFVTQVGAWSCVFSSPQRNFSEVGLRLLADTLAQIRPLTILHHDTEIDPDGQILRDAYRFLYATEPLPPPVSPSVFFYCQPYRVPQVRFFLESMRSADVAFSPAQAINLEDLRDETGAVPNWLAAGERFVEQQRLDLNRAIQLNTASDISRSTSETVNATLEQMREILSRSARTRKGGQS